MNHRNVKLDFNDMTPVNAISIVTTIVQMFEDANWNGIIDSGDKVLVDKNVFRFDKKITP